MKRKILTILTTVLVVGAVFAPGALAHDGVGGDEYAAADIMLIAALLFFVAAAFGLLWSINNGELKHPEDVKRRMLELAVIDEDGNDVEMYTNTEEQYFEDYDLPNLTDNYAPARVEVERTEEKVGV